jgi:protein-tyrosine phosphatase
MPTDLRWITAIQPLQLAITPKPRSGEWLNEEITGWKAERINTVVALLERHEFRELDLSNEQTLCESVGVSFVNFPIPDRGVPSSIRSIHLLVVQIVEELRAGRGVAIHCRAGIGRTGVVAACVLLHLGFPFVSIFKTLSDSRGIQMPDTDEQISWVKAYSLWLRE